MATMNRLGDTHVAGTLSCETFTAPDSCIGDDQIETPSGTDNGVRATKSQQQYVICYGQNATAVTERRVVHTVYGAVSSLVDVDAGAGVACVGAATVTVDVKKNGTTVLSALATLTSSVAAYALAAATISTSTAVAGDVFEVSFTATAGGGTVATRPFVRLVFREDPL